MRILITGATGFIGTRLSRFLLDKGYSVIGLGRSDAHPFEERDNFTYISADSSISGDWQDALLEVDAIVNLAGVSIFRYWTKDAKSQIYNSRILTTRNIVRAMLADKKQVLINASAIGYYGDRADEMLNEHSTHGSDFLADVCFNWEKEAFLAADKNTRVAAVRFGPVFAKNDGPLPTMILSFKLFAGGALGSGKQWMSWIHIQDLLSAILFILENENISGPANFSAPSPVRNEEFSKTVGKILKRPSFFKVPAFAMKLTMGEMGEAMMFSQKALPEVLLRNEFEFEFPRLREALEDLLK